VKIHIPSPLRSYTGDQPVVEASGATVLEVLGDLDRQYPGIRFRMVDEQGQIRRHLRLYRGEKLVRTVEMGVAQDEEIIILCALSGG